ncbi:MAG: CDGSH iron-sulfur domain-containing protein [Labedaea sp.]
MTAPSGPAEGRGAVQVPGGPLLVEGPVELVLADGTPVRSDRFLVAVCTCRRSKRYPLCDTSHRRRVRTGQQGGGG